MHLTDIQLSGATSTEFLSKKEPGISRTPAQGSANTFWCNPKK